MTKQLLIVGKNVGAISGVNRLVSLLPAEDTTYSAGDDDSVFIHGARVFSTASASAIGSAPVNVDGSKMMYYCDDAGGDVTINLGNPALLADHPGITFKRISAGGNDIMFNPFASEVIEFTGGSQILIPNIGDAITLRTNGTDWFIIANKI